MDGELEIPAVTKPEPFPGLAGAELLHRWLAGISRCSLPALKICFCKDLPVLP